MAIASLGVGNTENSVTGLEGSGFKLLKDRSPYQALYFYQGWFLPDDDLTKVPQAKHTHSTLLNCLTNRPSWITNKALRPRVYPAVLCCQEYGLGRWQAQTERYFFSWMPLDIMTQKNALSKRYIETQINFCWTEFTVIYQLCGTCTFFIKEGFLFKAKYSPFPYSSVSKFTRLLI